MSYFNNVEPMQLDASIDDAEVYDNSDSTPVNSDTLTHQVESSPFEIESYASQYSDFAKLSRLLYIADHCPSLQVDALEQAMKYVKEKTLNVNSYINIHHKLSEAFSNSGQINKAEQLDNAWIEKTNNLSQVYLEKLETDLKNYKTNSIKESIRRGHDDLGMHYLRCGDLTNALKCFSRSRDYCMDEHQFFNICLNIIKISIYLKNWVHVNSFIQKVESQEYKSNTSCQTKFDCVAGLHDLVTKRYKSAAKHFIGANIDDINQEYSDIMSPNNIAIYGGLCALASFDRVDLHKNVLSSSTFKLFLELEPQLREAIHKFYESKYQVCLSLLDELKDSFLLDIYLAPHVKNLYSLIRNRAMIQYFSPYLSADLHLMASAFNTNIEQLEDELTQLILDGQIQARIDSHNKILLAKDTDQRLLTFEKAIEMGKEWQMKATALVLRAACARNGMIYVRLPQSRSNKPDDLVPSASSINNICSPSSPSKARN